jgi:hypothetical protein
MRGAPEVSTTAHVHAAAHVTATHVTTAAMATSMTTAAMASSTVTSGQDSSRRRRQDRGEQRSNSKRPKACPASSLHRSSPLKRNGLK